MQSAFYRYLAKQTKAVLHFTGSTALTRGQFVNMLPTAGTATAIDESRDNDCAQPTSSNNMKFGGVVTRDYAANALGQDIEVVVEGFCLALVVASQTIGVNTLVGAICASATAANVGCFGQAGLAAPLRGSAWVRQSVTVSSAPVLCLVELCGKIDGEESGEIEEMTCAAGGGAITPMVGGLTVFAAQTLAADATFTLANGLFKGMRKRVYLAGAQTTNNIVATITTGSFGSSTAAAMTAWQTITDDGVGDYWEAEWDGTRWILLSHVSDAIT
jgi:hypothetical protein